MKLFPILVLCAGAASAQDHSTKTFSEHDFQVVKRSISLLARDPESIVVTRLWVQEGKFEYKVICGAVNAKNAYGGYTGEQLFTAMYAVNEEHIEHIKFADQDISPQAIVYGCKDRGMLHEQFQRIDVE